MKRDKGVENFLNRQLNQKVVKKYGFFLPFLVLLIDSSSKSYDSFLCKYGNSINYYFNTILFKSAASSAGLSMKEIPVVLVKYILSYNFGPFLLSKLISIP